MRNKKIFKRIAVEVNLYHQLLKDKAKFQKEIGGGKWSISDTINELKKISSMGESNDRKRSLGENN